MKARNFIFAAILAMLSASGSAQEFTLHEKGLLYDAKTMEKIKFMVDSLNIRFRTCDPWKIYYANRQAKAHYLSLSGKNCPLAEKAIREGVPWDEIGRNFNEAKTDTMLLVSIYQYTNYEKKQITEVCEIPTGRYDGRSIELEKADSWLRKNVQSTYFYRYDPATKYSENQLQAFYFVTDFGLPAIPEPYSLWIQYSDCLVDTTQTVFLANATEDGVRYAEKKNKPFEKFLLKAEVFPGKPEVPEYLEGSKKNAENYRVYSMQFATWDSLRMIWLDSAVGKDTWWLKKLTDAKDEAVNNHTSSEKLEFYVERYISKSDALKLKRGRIVVGGCSMDNSPRRHAFEIARLAAETVSWEIFLRAHLDIMNDRFSRVSDGSYAWAGRSTYLRELEELDINVADFLMGLILSIENPSGTHYFGGIGRIGRALAETKDPSLIEEKILSAIGDSALDDFNRMRYYYLFLNYNSYITDTVRQLRNKTRLTEAIASLPSYLSFRLLQNAEAK